MNRWALIDLDGYRYADYSTLREALDALATAPAGTVLVNQRKDRP